MIFLAKNRQYICQLRYITLILIVSLLLQALKAQFFVILQFSSTTPELKNKKLQKNFAMRGYSGPCLYIKL